MNAAGQELKLVRLELPIELHKRLRMEAARQERSRAWLARKLVEDGLKRKGGDTK
jgi:hypothetical protein